MPVAPQAPRPSAGAGGRLLPVPDAPLPQPPTRSAGALLRWLLVRAWKPVLVATLAATTSNVIQAIVPGFLGAALDSGIENGLNPRLWAIGLGLLLLFCVYAVGDTGLSYFRVHAWMRVSFDVDRLVARQVSTTGTDLGRQTSTGEVAAIVASDAQYLGNVVERLPGLIGAAVSFLVVAVLMLGTSVRLGLIALIGMPLVAWIVTLVIKPLQRRQAHQREAQSQVTTITTDTVAGLRILRGIGGEDVFARRYRDASQELRRRGVSVAGTQSVLMSLQVLLPGLFVAVVVWAAARMAVAGQISAGELVTFYGYTAYLSWPLMEFSNSVQDLTRARVGARRLLRLLTVSLTAGSVTERLDLDPAQGTAVAGALVDHASGVRIEPGRMTALVAADPDLSAALATRLGRFHDDGPVVTLTNRPLTDMPLADVRASVVVSGATAQLFTGTLRQALDVRGGRAPQPVGVAALVAAEDERAGSALDQDVRAPVLRADGDDRLLAALEVADAHDVLSSLEHGLAGMVTEKGRSLSGGQRQRVALARALLTEAPALVLIEPTSALDSHTESRVARRVHAARRGRTTVIVTESPLVLEACDEVVLLDDEGRERVRSTHRDLLARARQGQADALAYRAVVARASGEAEPGAPTPGGTEPTAPPTGPDTVGRVPAHPGTTEEGR
ncbi:MULTISPECIES: ABC transporter ATP-binding protein [unclassified Actinomyces]|uniref:ABC transporter ATP-binding protein n=1 Tax=unclassified Actinomyces TaxID=2609248 RepID=UPI002017A79D|nr:MULTISPECIES: ABC transporter ATP-binding protein [unclassified Actinomyces]MCL3777744.1 ABC transporter ATP-binding protein [Actinomyces sp. AC-20-1]MCL3790702.1 ABC transporter ATP-binding protein [Actinomyces sp. 187325]MCL3793004.1 ABC transporter ATP-binding protein [Actinomyces sp. 186855]MCL3795325.1 ABC transporter ATP-binding protein [Actinomyces sp. 217892]